MMLSVVTALAPGESLKPSYFESFASADIEFEWIFVSSDQNTLESALEQAKKENLKRVGNSRPNLKYSLSESGRAKCMNKGSMLSAGEMILFLHADSYFERGSLEGLVKGISVRDKSRHCIYYFDLAYGSGISLMRLTEWGVRLRCHLWKIPFGDQGLCLSKETFSILGLFDENAAYGEDHLLIRRANRMGIPVVSVGKRIYSSPRKYVKNGWLRTTVQHQWMWYKQILDDRMREAVIIVFAKTPGLSPVKSRLAADIGKEEAEEFYRLSVAAVFELLQAAQKQCASEGIQLDIRWAVAEQEGPSNSFWNGYSTIWTGDGDLGERLNRVTKQLFSKYRQVTMLGTDSPQLDLTLIVSAVNRLKNGSTDCLAGPCTDGGFYLFGSKLPLEDSIWRNIAYSQEDTLQQLLTHLDYRNIGYDLLCHYGDVDYKQDLVSLHNALKDRKERFPAQLKLLDWLESRMII